MAGPMRLSTEAIDAFKRIYQSEFGDILSDDEAGEMALRLLRIFDLLSRPFPGEGDQA